jgi:hypothetical protein
MLASDRNRKTCPRAVRFDSDNLTLAHNLRWTDNVVSLYLNDEFYIAMLRNARIRLQQNTADTYVVAHSAKLRNRISETNS